MVTAKLTIVYFQQVANFSDLQDRNSAKQITMTFHIGNIRPNLPNYFLKSLPYVPSYPTLNNN